jgi:hypothetical protein
VTERHPVAAETNKATDFMAPSQFTNRWLRAERQS